ncbi:hypothetical protein BRC89_04430 [Halobacteriales archaeon QS_4_70_19]|nr:MAG: hypothetical protein BRC89_04430 [Halobacteriales archaeon QS_4_70_19]
MTDPTEPDGGSPTESPEPGEPGAPDPATPDGAGGQTAQMTESSAPRLDQYADLMDRFIRGVEISAATVFAFLFAVGVVDLALQIFQSVQSGAITDPLVVIGFIDTGLLLLIIVEVYQTVLAYVKEDDTRRIVRLVIYTGVIAMVRKAIIFRTGEYGSEMQALTAASAYTILILGLIGLLFVEQAFGDRLLGE